MWIEKKLKANQIDRFINVINEKNQKNGGNKAAIKG